MKLNLRKLFRYTIFTVLLFLLVTFSCNWWVSHSSRNRMYSQIDSVPPSHVGLVLGTSKYLTDGRINLYFRYRMEAAVALYKAGKVQYLLVSGDNREINYNEPERMRRELIEQGVPNDRIVLDYAGFRTLDSVIRSQKVFGQDTITIISQAFHNQRALYIAQHHGIGAVAFNAQDVSAYQGFKTNLRELMARVKMFIDLYLIRKEPYFLGDPVVIPN